MSDVSHPDNPLKLTDLGVKTQEATKVGGKKEIVVQSVSSPPELFTSMSEGDFIDRNHLADLRTIDLHIGLLNTINAKPELQNLASLLQMRTETMGKINARLNDPGTDLIKELTTPDPSNPDDTGKLIAQYRVLGDTIDRLSQPGAKTQDVIKTMTSEYGQARKDVIARKKQSLVKNMRDEDYNLMYDSWQQKTPDFTVRNRMSTDLARVLIAENTGNMYEITSVEAQKQAVLRATKAVTSEYTASGGKLGEYTVTYLDSLSDYAKEKGLLTTGEFASALPSNMQSYREALIGGVTTKSVLLTESLPASVKVEKATLVSTENVFYKKDAVFYGDQHGDIELPTIGETGVYTGDIIDGKGNMYKAGKLDLKRFEGDLNIWMDKVESGEVIFNLGNHDMTPLYIYALNEHIDTLRRNGAPQAEIVTWETNMMDTFHHWVFNGGGDLVATGLGITIPKDSAGHFSYTVTDIKNILANKTLTRFNQDALKYGRLYSIVNETFVAHTVPLADANGNLIPFEEGLTGLDGLDFLQQKLRKGDLQTIQRLWFTDWQVYSNNKGTKDILECGPLWNREEQLEPIFPPNATPESDSRVEKLIGQLDKQAQARGTRIQRIAFGHISRFGEAQNNGKIINLDQAQEFNKRQLPKARSKARGINHEFTYHDKRDKIPVQKTIGTLRKSV